MSFPGPLNFVRCDSREATRVRVISDGRPCLRSVDLFDDTSMCQRD